MRTSTIAELTDRIEEIGGPPAKPLSGCVVLGGVVAFCILIAVVVAGSMLISQKPPTAEFTIENTTGFDLEDALLVTAKGKEVDLGSVPANSRRTDPRVTVLGPIHYQLRYTIQGSRYISRHFFSGDTKLAHRFALDDVGQYQWLPPSTDGYVGHQAPPGYEGTDYRASEDEATWDY
jgi:hypothetical protein